MTQISSGVLPTDDPGDNSSGTKLNRSFFSTLKSAIDALIHNASYPTRTPADMIDWLENLRGNKSTPDERISVFLDDDGNPRSLSGVPSATDIVSQLGNKNLWWDSLFSCWPDGDSSAPAGWTLSGTGASVVRCGNPPAGYEASPPADTTQFKYGFFTAKLTYGSASAKLTRTLIPTGYMPSGLKGRTFTFLVRAKASSAVSASSFTVTDGVQTVRGGTSGNGTYASVTTEGWLYCTITIDNSATKLELVLEQGLSGSCYFGAGVILLGNYTATDYVPEHVGLMVVADKLRGNAAVTTTVNELRHPSLVYGTLRSTMLNCKTAPTTQAIIAKPQKGISSNMYTTTFPQIAAAATQSSELKANGTYANRCIKPGSIISWDITQVGSGTTGDEVNINMLFNVFIDPFFQFTQL